MRTLHYAGIPGEGYGWGVCNTNLRRELGKLYNLTGPDAEVCFMPLADHDFNPATNARGKINLAYTFFESELGPNAATNAAKYDVVFCGSTWCLERMKERGITNGSVLIQGVDSQIFKPEKWYKDKRFRVFTGGKFEYRKGHDLVIAAFSRFVRTHSDAILVCAWHNPWPRLIESLRESPHIIFPPLMSESQEDFFNWLLYVNRIEPCNYCVLPPLRQEKLAEYMQVTDVGLFPNRCEGGTNLVLMEYLACGRPAVANLKTGHADLRGAAIYEIPAQEDANHWAEQSVEDIVETLELAHSIHKAKNPRVPERTQWLWSDAARTIQDTVADIDVRILC